MPSGCVYKIKRDGVGNVQWFKAMLVCGGNHQIIGVNYQATYAPTARLGHIRLALAISPKYDLEIHQMDVCMVFLGVNWEGQIYMQLPQGYFCLVQTGSRYYDPRSKTSQKMVRHLRKSLYGLKRSLHVWYGTFQNFVISIGFVASHVNWEVFVLGDQGSVVTAVIPYVIDLFIILIKALIGQIKDQMKMRFRMNNVGSFSFYLGMNIERNWEHHTIHIHQRSYIWTILAMFRMDESRPVATPMAMKLHKRKPNQEACDPTIYQSMIGTFMYMMTATQPDIAYAIGVHSQHNHDLSHEHMVALKRVFRYLNGMKYCCLVFGGALGEALRAALRQALREAIREVLQEALWEALGGALGWEGRRRTWILCQFRLCWMPRWL